jgi:chaperonin GroES
MELKPLGDVVYIRRLQPAQMSAGGVFLPCTDEFTEDIGEVVAAGPGKTTLKGAFIPITVKKGDRVMFSTHGHQVTKFLGEELIVCREPSIMGVIEQ